MQGWKNIQSIRALFPNFYQEIRIYIARLSLKPARICCPSLDMTTWCLKNQSKSILDAGCLYTKTSVWQQDSSLQFRIQPNCFLPFFPSGVLSHELLLSLCFSERQVFLATWKDIPNDSEAQFQIKDIHLNSGNRNKYVLCMSELGKVCGGNE